MTKQTDEVENKIHESLMWVAEKGQDVYERLRKSVNYTDGRHKQFTAEIAALNVTQNAVGKAIIHRAMISRALAVASVPAQITGK